MEPTCAVPEVNAHHVLGVRLAPGLVIALRHHDMRVVVMPRADTRDWRGRAVATVIATRAQVTDALAHDEADDIAAADELADEPTDDVEHLLGAAAAA